MSLKNTGKPSGKPAPAKPADKRGELDANDLDKVVGGMKSTGGAVKRPTVNSNDPCDGGE